MHLDRTNRKFSVLNIFCEMTKNAFMSTVVYSSSIYDIMFVCNLRIFELIQIEHMIK